jgi:hypothetical protein
MKQVYTVMHGQNNTQLCKRSFVFYGINRINMRSNSKNIQITTTVIKSSATTVLKPTATTVLKPSATTVLKPISQQCWYTYSYKPVNVLCSTASRIVTITTEPPWLVYLLKVKVTGYGDTKGEIRSGFIQPM